MDKAFIAYGAIMYALLGIAGIPEMKKILYKFDNRYYKKAIIFATIIPAILYLIFMFTIIGITGDKTSLNPITELGNIFGNRIVLIGATLGFLITITSFFSLGLAMKETYISDFNLNKNVAWALTCFVPLILFVVGAYNFVSVIAILGALIAVIEGTSIVLIYNSIVRPCKALKVVGYCMILVFVLGFAYVLKDIL